MQDVNLLFSFARRCCDYQYLLSIWVAVFTNRFCHCYMDIWLGCQQCQEGTNTGIFQKLALVQLYVITVHANMSIMYWNVNLLVGP